MSKKSIQKTRRLVFEALEVREVLSGTGLAAFVGIPTMPAVLTSAAAPPVAPITAPAVAPIAAPPVVPITAPPMTPIAAPPMAPIASPALSPAVLNTGASGLTSLTSSPARPTAFTSNVSTPAGNVDLSANVDLSQPVQTVVNDVRAVIQSANQLSRQTANALDLQNIESALTPLRNALDALGTKLASQLKTGEFLATSTPTVSSAGTGGTLDISSLTALVNQSGTDITNLSDQVGGLRGSVLANVLTQIRGLANNVNSLANTINLQLASDVAMASLTAGFSNAAGDTAALAGAAGNLSGANGFSQAPIQTLTPSTDNTLFSSTTNSFIPLIDNPLANFQNSVSTSVDLNALNSGINPLVDTLSTDLSGAGGQG